MGFRPRLLLLCLSLVVDDISSRDLRQSRDLVADTGLYGEDSKVVRLNSTNIETIYGTDNAWLVEFYASWCGHCQRYAPIYEALGEDVVGWQSVVKVAAVDCAARINSELCREYAVEHYPSLRFFPDHSEKGYLGLNVNKSYTAENLRRDLVALLLSEQQGARGQSWPQLTPFREDVPGGLWTNVPSSVKYQILVHEDEKSLLGAENILDLARTKNILARRILNGDGLNNTLRVSVFHKDAEEEDVLDIHDSTRGAILSAETDFLSSRGIRVAVGDEVGGDIEEEIINKEIEYVENDMDSKVYRSDVLYQVDLENAVRYSFKREISVQNVISGEPLRALMDYLMVLENYFPIDKIGSEFFKDLRTWVSLHDSLRGEDFLHQVQVLEEQKKPVFRSNEEWLGCKGSSKRYRGYPCGVWTLFHTLTVNAVIKKGASGDFTSSEVLDAMVGYIRHFFGCRECSEHFQEMARESLQGNVSTPDSGIEWLWRAHNTVNRRLAGDLTEDPKHPKIQFPSQESCPACRDASGQWQTAQVLDFLKGMYGRDSIDRTNWGAGLEPAAQGLPTAENYTPDNSKSGSAGWSNIGVPLFLGAFAAAGVLVFITSA